MITEGGRRKGGGGGKTGKGKEETVGRGGGEGRELIVIIVFVSLHKFSLYSIRYLFQPHSASCLIFTLEEEQH